MYRKSIALVLALLPALAGAVGFSLVTPDQLQVRQNGTATELSGQRITAHIDNDDGSTMFSAQADNYRVDATSPGGGDSPAVVLTGNVVISDGITTLTGRTAIFDVEGNELVVIGVQQGQKSGGVLAYSCRRTQLYRNGERVDGDSDLVCGGRYCILYTCNSRGELIARIVFQEP